jgi:hypothetical protein
MSILFSIVQALCSRHAMVAMRLQVSSWSLAAGRAAMRITKGVTSTAVACGSWLLFSHASYKCSLQLMVV